MTGWVLEEDDRDMGEPQVCSGHFWEVRIVSGRSSRHFLLLTSLNERLLITALRALNVKMSMEKLDIEISWFVCF